MIEGGGGMDDRGGGGEWMIKGVREGGDRGGWGG